MCGSKIKHPSAHMSDFITYPVCDITSGGGKNRYYIYYIFFYVYSYDERKINYKID